MESINDPQCGVRGEEEMGDIPKPEPNRRTLELATGMMTIEKISGY